MEAFDIENYVNFDGTVTKQKPVGYCTYPGHKGYITKNEAKTHKCFSKSCKYFIKNDGSDFVLAVERERIRKKYFDFIKREYYRNEIGKKEYDDLKKMKKLEKMEKYIESRQQDVVENNRTISNYVKKEIVHPKKPNIIARIRNKIKTVYNRWKKWRIDNFLHSA